MKILLGLINDVEKAEAATQQLFPAIKKGSVKEADFWSQKLRQSVAEGYTVFLSENSWFDMLKKIRQIKPDFKADYIYKQQQIDFLHNHAQLLPEELGKLVAEAVNQKKNMLQLPLEDENNE